MSIKISDSFADIDLTFKTAIVTVVSFIKFLKFGYGTGFIKLTLRPKAEKRNGVTVFFPGFRVLQYIKVPLLLFMGGGGYVTE